MLPLQTELPQDVNVVPYQCLRNLNTLGEGGFGIVYRAEHEDWGTVAYKELKTSFIRPNARLVTYSVSIKTDNRNFIIRQLFEDIYINFYYQLLLFHLSNNTILVAPVS